jgi:hypothetical protein
MSHKNTLQNINPCMEQSGKQKYHKLPNTNLTVQGPSCHLKIVLGRTAALLCSRVFYSLSNFASQKI